MWISGGLNKIVVLAILSIAVLAMTVLSGCTNKPPEGIRVNYSVDVSVVDENGINIHDQSNIYEIEGVLSNTSRVGYSQSYGAGITVNGSSHYNGSDWPVSRGNYMVFGASTDKGLLDEDWNKRKFDPGSAGYWTVLTYDDITKNTNGRQNVTLHVDIVVQNKTGRMLERPQAVTYSAGPGRESVNGSGP